MLAAGRRLRVGGRFGVPHISTTDMSVRGGFMLGCVDGCLGDFMLGVGRRWGDLLEWIP